MDPELTATRPRASVRFLSIALVIAVTLIAAELLVRFVSPRPSMYPRWEFSPQYGSLLFPNRTMVHEQPGRWRFTYTTNEHRCRGAAVPISNHYDRTNVLVLGDSNSFGNGVNDGEEYAAVLDELLDPECDVVNLAVGGWGLTQHVRRYYEFGQVYQPGVVILQFAGNDPYDNFKNRVTTVDDGRFTFHDSALSINWVKRYLSASPIQKSQLYNLFRNRLYRRFERRAIDGAVRSAQESGGSEVRVEEAFYNELFDAFVRDLDARETTILVIAVEGRLDEYPAIRRKFEQLESMGLIDYLETSDWLAGEDAPGSPEGHPWGPRAHWIIGENLSEVIRGVLASR